MLTKSVPLTHEAYRFPEPTSLTICLSSDRLATWRFKRTFSCFRFFIRFAWSHSTPKRSWRHRQWLCRDIQVSSRHKYKFFLSGLQIDEQPQELLNVKPQLLDDQTTLNDRLLQRLVETTFISGLALGLASAKRTS